MTFLARLGIPARCISGDRQASEHGRRTRLDLPDHFTVERAKVDGCWCQDGDPERVDYLFSVASSQGNGIQRAVLIELKGRHFEKALTQIDSTLKRLTSLPAWRGTADMKTFAFVVLANGREVRGAQEKQLAVQKRHNVRITAKENLVITTRSIDL